MLGRTHPECGRLYACAVGATWRIGLNDPTTLTAISTGASIFENIVLEVKIPINWRHRKILVFLLLEKNWGRLS